MRKREGMSLLAKFCLVMALIVLLAGAVIYELTGRLSRSTFTLSDRKELESAAQTAREKLALYNSGWLWQMELQSIVNPTINPGDVFLLLADSSGRVIAYTELGVPYFGSSKLRYYLEQLRTGSAINLSVQDNNSLVLIHGERTEAGDYILAGKPLRVFQWTLTNFRNKLLLWLVPVLLLLIAAFAFAGRRAMRPLKALKAAAQDVEQGKAALVTTDMPGEMADVASAFNHMSAQVSKTIRDLNQEKENMLRILEGLSEGVLTMTEDGRVLQRNRACLTLLGGEDAPAYQEVSDALRAALKQKREGSGKLNQGKTVLQYDITMLPGLDGQNGAIACIRDITEGERLDKEGQLRQFSLTVESIGNASLSATADMNEKNVELLTSELTLPEGWRCLGVLPDQLQDLTESADSAKIIYRLLQGFTIYVERVKEEEEPEEPADPTDPTDPTDPGEDENQGTGSTDTPLGPAHEGGGSTSDDTPGVLTPEHGGGSDDSHRH